MTENASSSWNLQEWEWDSRRMVARKRACPHSKEEKDSRKQFRASEAAALGPREAQHNSSGGKELECCQVPCCHTRLSLEGERSLQLKTCNYHRNALAVLSAAGKETRFCFKCLSFHGVEKFKQDSHECSNAQPRSTFRERRKLLQRRLEMQMRLQRGSGKGDPAPRGGDPCSAHSSQVSARRGEWLHQLRDSTRSLPGAAPA